MTGVDHCIFSLLCANWRQIVAVTFADDLSSTLGCHSDVVLHSVCRLWNKMIKPRSSWLESHGCYDAFIDSSAVLLDTMKSGQIPALCRSKCLTVLMQTVHVDLTRSTKVVPWMLAAADRTVNTFCSDHLADKSLTDKSWSFDCCLAANNPYSSFTASHTLTSDKTNSVPLVGGEINISSDNGHHLADTVAVDCSHPLVYDTSWTTVTASHGLVYPVQASPPSHCVQAFSKDLCDRQSSSYDAKLVRKFVLLLLRSLDITARETANESKPLNSEQFMMCVWQV